MNFSLERKEIKSENLSILNEHTSEVQFQSSTGIENDNDSDNSKSKLPSIEAFRIIAPEEKRTPVPLPRMSIARKALLSVTNNSLQKEDNKSNTNSEVLPPPTFEPITSPRFVSEVSANLRVKPPPRKVFTFNSNSNANSDDEEEEEERPSTEESFEIKPNPIERKFLKPVSLVNRHKLSSQVNEKVDNNITVREKSLSLETKKENSTICFKNEINARRSLRETSLSSKTIREDQESAGRRSSGKQDLIKLYDLPDGKCQVTSTDSELSSKAFFLRDESPTPLAEWERIQRKNIEDDERNRLNKSLSVKPMTAKIRDIVKFPGVGFKSIFNKEKKTDIMGTVDGAGDIVFTRIPSGKSESKDDEVSTMKSPNMVKNVIQMDQDKQVSEESIYSDVVNGLNVTDGKPGSPVYVKTSIDLFNSELLFGNRAVRVTPTTTKQMNIERAKDIARAKVSPRHRNRSPRRSPSKESIINCNPLQKSPTDDPEMYYVQGKHSEARRSLRESISEKIESKIMNSNSASSLADLERKQRFKEASSIFRKNKVNQKKPWHEEKIPLYTSSWKFLAPSGVEESTEKVGELPTFIRAKSPPVRLTQIIGDSASENSSAATTPLVSPRTSPERSQLSVIKSEAQSESILNRTGTLENEEKMENDSSSDKKVDTENTPEPPPRRSKSIVHSLIQNSRLSERNESSLESFNLSKRPDLVSAAEEHLPPVAPKRKSFHFGMETDKNELIEHKTKYGMLNLSSKDNKTTNKESNESPSGARYNSYNRDDPNHYKSASTDRTAPKLKFYDHSSPAAMQRIPRKERPRNSERSSDAKGLYRHVSADRHEGYSFDRIGRRDDKRYLSNRKVKETERRVKVTTYKLGEKLVRENTEKFRTPIGLKKDITENDSKHVYEVVSPKKNSNRSDWLGVPKDDNERHQRSSRRREYDARRSEMQKRSRSEGRPLVHGRERKTSLDRNYSRHGKREPSNKRDRKQETDNTDSYDQRKTDRKSSENGKKNIYNSTKHSNVYYMKKSDQSDNRSKSSKDKAAYEKISKSSKDTEANKVNSRREKTLDSQPNSKQRNQDLKKKKTKNPDKATEMKEKRDQHQNKVSCSYL